MGGCASSGSVTLAASAASRAAKADAREKERERERFQNLLGSIEPFSELSEGLIDELFYKSERVEVVAKQAVYKRKEAADALYMVLRGAVVSDDNLDRVKADEVFGHYEIIEGVYRQKTMKAERGGATLRKVYGMDYSSAVDKRRALLQTNAYRVLCETPVFAGLSERELMHLKNLVLLKSCAPGEVIIQRGSTSADEMYIIESGSAVVSDYADASSDPTLLGLIPLTILPKEITLAAPGYFGEEALLCDDDDMDVGERPTRKATVKAGPQGCVCLVLNRDVFDRVLSKIKHRFYRNLIARDAEIVAMVERGEKAAADRDVWDKHRSGKYKPPPPPPPSAPQRGAPFSKDVDDKAETAAHRREAESVSRRASSMVQQPQGQDRNSKRKKAAHHGERRRLGGGGGGGGGGDDDGSADAAEPHETWVSTLFCGAGTL